MSTNAQKNTFFTDLATKLDGLRQEGLYKPEHVISSRQGAVVTNSEGRQLINLCANNYLGLSGDEELVQASIKATEEFGYLSSVRFICGANRT